MAAVTTALLGVVAVLLAVGAYALVSYALLFHLPLPDEGSARVLEDVVFAVTLPFAAAVVVLSAARKP